MPAENADAAPKTVKVAIKKADTNETEWSMDVAPELLHEALVMRDMLGDNRKSSCVGPFAAERGNGES